MAEYKGFDHAISDFEVDEDHIYTYINPLPDEPFIEVYTKTAGSVTYRLGKTENEQVISNLNRCSGDINVYKGDLLFIPAHKFLLHKASPDSFSSYTSNFSEDPEL